MTQRNYKLTETLHFHTPDHDVTGVYLNGEFMRHIQGAEGALIDEVLDLERRLNESDTLLDMVFDYVDTTDLAKLGESRVQALIDDHQRVIEQRNKSFEKGKQVFEQMQHAERELSLLRKYIEDLRKAHNQSDVLVHSLLQRGPQ